MQVTREFLMAHRTARGAWTRAQLQALGLRWPPLQGWIDSVVGQELTDAQVEQFKDDSIPRKGQVAANPNQLDLFWLDQQSHRHCLKCTLIGKLCQLQRDEKNQNYRKFGFTRPKQTFLWHNCCTAAFYERDMS